MGIELKLFESHRGIHMTSGNDLANELRRLSLWVAIVPLAAINASYLIAAGLDHVRTCIPYLSGCTSVSSTGRAIPEAIVFKAGMLSAAVVIAILWHRSAAFLQTTGRAGSQVVLLRVFGLIAAFSLTLYAATLGLTGDYFATLRRTGIVGFAYGNWFVQITFIILFWPQRAATTRPLLRWLILLSIALLAVGATSELAKSMGAPRKLINSVAAWNAFVLLSAYYAVLARIWWHQGRSAGRAASPSE